MKIKQQDDIYREVDVQWDELNVYDKYGSLPPEARMQGLTIDTNHTIPEMAGDGMSSMGMGMGMGMGMISGEQGHAQQSRMLGTDNNLTDAEKDKKARQDIKSPKLSLLSSPMGFERAYS